MKTLAPPPIPERGGRRRADPARARAVTVTLSFLAAFATLAALFAAVRYGLIVTIAWGFAGAGFDPRLRTEAQDCLLVGGAAALLLVGAGTAGMVQRYRRTHNSGLRAP